MAEKVRHLLALAAIVAAVPLLAACHGSPAQNIEGAKMGVTQPAAQHAYYRPYEH